MPGKKKKSDEATVRARVEEVLQIVLDGAAYPDVVQYAAEKGWGLRERQLREYMSRATDLLVQRQERKRSRLVALHLSRREKLFARCVNAASYRDALACLTDLAKLQGLYPDGKELRELVKLATAQADRLRELEARLDAATRDQSPAETAGSPAGPDRGPAPDPGRSDSDLPG